MPYSEPRTWVDTEIVTVTNFNTHIRDNLREQWHELSYTEFTASVAATAPGATVVTSGAITYLAAPVLIEFFCVAIDTTATLRLFDGATDLGVLSTGPNQKAPLVRTARKLTPTAGSHTYLIKAFGSGVVTAGAGGAGNSMPGYLRILQRGIVTT